jgi:NIMA (never in mitosis gene a)-related kinase
MHQSTVDKTTHHHGDIQKQKSIGDMINEIHIIKQQLRHPNIVRYRRVFVDSDKLYIVMDLINGASLKQHINSIVEKGSFFKEQRIWHIIVQVLVLKYFLGLVNFSNNNIHIFDGTCIAIST